MIVYRVRPTSAHWRVAGVALRINTRGVAREQARPTGAGAPLSATFPARDCPVRYETRSTPFVDHFWFFNVDRISFRVS